MAVLAMASHRLRTLLTMLGIIIGIASVVSVVALGEGSRQRILKDISSMGTNTINIYPGKDFGDMRSGKVQTLIPRDADALAQQPYVDTVTPMVTKSVTLLYRNISVTALVNGVGEHYFRVKGLELAEGQRFDRTSVRTTAQDVVIDDNTRRSLFTDHPGPVLGQVIMLGTMPCRIIGVTKKKDSSFGDSDSLNVWVPYTTAMTRLTGQQYLRSIIVRVADDVNTSVAEQSAVKLLTQRHGTKDFFVSNLDAIRQTIDPADLLHCPDLAGGRGDRGDEHHVGFGNRTNPGNWSPHGRRRPPQRHHAAVSYRSGAGLPARRPPWRWPRPGHWPYREVIRQ
jgi:macrolide transport system ATP-binding/permease protein